MHKSSILSLAGALVGMALLSAGCGGARQKALASPSASGTGAPPVVAQRNGGVSRAGGVAAQIGNSTIPVAIVERLVGEEESRESPSERLVPPAFTACVRHLEAAVTSAGQALRPRVSALRGACQAKYRTVRERVLGALILDVWVIGAARELGVDVSEQEVKRRQLSRSARVNVDAEAVRRKIKGDVGAMTTARIAAYYRAHKQLFRVSQRRDVEIVRTDTEAQAIGVKRELASGRSFASVARGLPRPQPILSHDGLAKGVTPGFYHERPLNQAIFAAKLNVLSGPIRIVLGFYVFRVTRIVAGYQRGLSNVALALSQRLPDDLYRRALAAFVRRWRAKWSARTSCSRGYVIPKCKQFRARSTPPEDPYSLD